MNDTAREYAVALFELAAEQDELTAVRDALTLVKALFDEQPAYVALLSSPAVSKDERLGALREAFGDLPQTVMSFLCVLCENGRMADVARCVDIYDELYRESQKVATAQVISAVPLTDEQQARLRDKLARQTGHTVHLRCSVDETMLGGVIVEMDGKRMDGSVKRRLQVLKDVMSE